ncbi:MAG: hypothetical protein IPP37_14400 [Saprospiraceae bacterium]|nr:hypothetical protein [Saprospiraceae bacterium]
MAKVRTIKSFQKLGELLVSDLNYINSEERTHIKQAVLSSFLVYVKIFQISQSRNSMKRQTCGRLLSFQSMGKDYSTDEYMEMAQNGTHRE